MTDSSTTKSIPYGIWLGGYFHGLESGLYRPSPGEDLVSFTFGVMHLTGAQASYPRFSIEDGAAVELPKDKPVLVNMRAYIKDREVRWVYSTEHPYMEAPEATDRDGKVRPLDGIFIIGTFKELISRQQRNWESKAPNAKITMRYLKLQMPRKQSPDYPEIVLPPEVPSPTFEIGEPLIVPVEAFATKGGIGYRLSTEFGVQKF